MHIVQIAPEIAPGSGVAMVAFALEREFVAVGSQVERFTLETARGRATRSPRSRLGHAWDVIWFSTFGTARAKRFLADRPDAVSICHNDAMTGDIYVNHGVVQAAMRARGQFVWRMIRNPLHLFTALRDRIRYRGHAHRAIVALSTTEAGLLRREYGTVRAPITVIGNGVDLDRFHPSTRQERIAGRLDLGIPADAYVVIFIGNEFERKGLPLIIDALRGLPDDVILVVVGGTERMIEKARNHATSARAADRVRFAGARRDVVPLLGVADVLVLPSAYEANALVLLEALACGVPILATPVGFATDLVRDGSGSIIEADSDDIAARVTALREGHRDTQRAAARAAATRFGWAVIANAYLRLADAIREEGDREMTDPAAPNFDEH